MPEFKYFGGKRCTDYNNRRKSAKMLKPAAKVLKRHGLVKNHIKEGVPIASFYWNSVRRYILQGRTVYLWGFGRICPRLYAAKTAINAEKMRFIPKPRIIVGFHTCAWLNTRKVKTLAELTAEADARIAKAGVNAARGKKIVGRGDLAMDMAAHFGMPLKRANQICIAMGYAAGEQMWELGTDATPMRNFVGFCTSRFVIKNPYHAGPVELRQIKVRTHKAFREELKKALTWKKTDGKIEFLPIAT